MAPLPPAPPPGPFPVPHQGLWRHLHPSTLRKHLPVLLCDDSCSPTVAARSLLIGGVPDAFTVAERLTSSPLWLDEPERDGDQWLRRLVGQRLCQHPQLDHGTVLFAAAFAHVHDQVRCLLDAPGVASTLWNQELPYVIDRVIAFSIFGDPALTPVPYPMSVQRGHEVGARLLDWFAPKVSHDLDELVRCCLAAGLLDLDIKGGPAICPPISTGRQHWYGPWFRQPKFLVQDLLAHAAETSMAVDHLPSLLAVVGRAGARLVWFTDDLVETAVDLLVIQRLLDLNPSLEVVIVPRSRRTDNDATHDDVTHLLRHRALRRLATDPRARVTTRGPGHAAPVPTKLHPVLLRELNQADAVMTKGGRNHELLVGTLARPVWTGYVVTREFTESQAGYDGRTAPLLLVHSPVGQPPWWGWRGRAHRRLAVAADRTVPACWTTIADHVRRTTTHDTGLLRRDLAALLDDLPLMLADYPTQATREIQQVASRLAEHGGGDLDLVHRARRLTGATPRDN